jgi:hypothetical protein
MGRQAFLSALAGASSVRRAVNAGFHVYASKRVRALAALQPVAVQERTLQSLLRKARATRFGRDHHFESIRSEADYQRRVPLRTYEDLWTAYLKERYPTFDNLTWPGRIPFLALSSGTTSGTTKYIPVSHEMVASNRTAAQTMLAYYLAARPDSRLFLGRLFFLGGSSDLETPAPGVRQGDLSGIAAKTVGPWLGPYTFPPLELALEPDWDTKLAQLIERGRREPITLVSGVSSCLITLFHRLLEHTGLRTIAEVWPKLEVVVHGGCKFDPYRDSCLELLGNAQIQLQESYPCSEGFIAFGDPATGLLRLLFDHGIFYEFVPVEELGAPSPTRHSLRAAQVGVNYAIVISTCAGMWAHIVGDTVRFESLSPPLLTFTGRTKYTLSAFGEHLISDELEGAVALASGRAGAQVREWHVGPVFHEPLGHHLYVFEFSRPPGGLVEFRAALDDALVHRNDHYQWFRAPGGGLPLPEIVVASPGSFESWMRARGQLGGQHKVPRIDSSGSLTAQLLSFLRAEHRVERELHAGAVDPP